MPANLSSFLLDLDLIIFTPKPTARAGLETVTRCCKLHLNTKNRCIDLMYKWVLSVDNRTCFKTISEEFANDINISR